MPVPMSMIEVPTLIVCAREDRLVPARSRPRERDFENASCIVMDAPHLLLQARPAEAARSSA